MEKTQSPLGKQEVHDRPLISEKSLNEVKLLLENGHKAADELIEATKKYEEAVNQIKDYKYDFEE